MGKKKVARNLCERLEPTKIKTTNSNTSSMFLKYHQTSITIVTRFVQLRILKGNCLSEMEDRISSTTSISLSTHVKISEEISETE